MTNMNSFWMQNFNNIMMKNMDIFNSSITNLIIFLSIFLSILIFFSFFNFNSMLFSNESNELELFWTIIPAFIILIISLPSMFLLYCYEENKFSFMDVKIIGNQWYWTYEYPNMSFVESYIKSSNFLRCMNTSNSLIIPSNKFIRLLLSSNDVLHSWTVPSLMSKMDAIPGRLNMMFLNCNKSILLKGQCSEICGINHSFMPISVLSLNLNKI
uniref:Cytochrome c oxidase subunit 2 n=1 Tax=Tetranychus ludeni TaxID=182134 RepID=A0A075X8Z5_TETLU|nr:cytochrome c oxidase subunit II [Tetranychus ludeni]AIH15658.1 cytochrome c oxidase subunit II [Tetranychus ludeni]